MDKIEVTQAIDWARKVASSKPPRYTDASRNAARYILATRTDATPVATDVAALVEAAKRQCDNMAFALNRFEMPDQWYAKFSRELEADRQALAPFTKGQP